MKIDKLNRRKFLKCFGASAAGMVIPVLTISALGANEKTVSEKKPNVLFIAVDDMNDWTEGLGGYSGKVYTPSQQRLAKMGMEFINAHTASSICCPSRAAIMTGLRPSTSGIYNNGQWWMPNRPDTVTIPMHFRNNGYYAAGSGKIFHHTAGNNPPSQWDEYKRLIFEDDPWFRGVKQNYPWSKPVPMPEGYPLCGIEKIPHEFDWGSLDKKESEYDDALSASFAVDFLKRDHGKPFFLACGIFRPHLPWYVPKKYFDMYPLDKIELPVVLDNDMDDIPKAGVRLSKARRSDFEKVKAAGKWKEGVQAYLASITFADAQVGRLLDALEKSDYAQNTVIVFWSDHGWHLGEKNHWHKMTLWEEATRVPFYICAPSVVKAGQQCKRPVGLIDVYPTLIDLCNLDSKPELDGVSLRPLLNNPEKKWDRPAITEYGRGQFAVRSQRWRYIRYQDGTEELYDHDNDPREWNNLASDSKYEDVKKDHARWIPEKIAEHAPTKGAYEFDYKSYSWKNKKTGKVVNGSIN